MDPTQELLTYLMQNNPMNWNLTALQQLITQAHGAASGGQSPWAGWPGMGHPAAMGGLGRDSSAGAGLAASLPDPATRAQIGSKGAFSGEAPLTAGVQHGLG